MVVRMNEMKPIQKLVVNYYYCLMPRNNKPLLANSTSSSNFLASLALHDIPSVLNSSGDLPPLYPVSKALFRWFNADMSRGSEWPVKMIKAVRDGRDSCNDLSWVFRLDRIGPRMWGAGGVVVGSTGESWVAVVVVGVVVVGDDDDCPCMRLSGVTLDVTPTIE